MVSWLVRSSPDRAVRFGALAGDIVLCSWARHFTLTVPLSTQVYEGILANLMFGTGEKRGPDGPRLVFRLFSMYSSGYSLWKITHTLSKSCAKR